MPISLKNSTAAPTAGPISTGLPRKQGVAPVDDFVPDQQAPTREGAGSLGEAGGVADSAIPAILGAGALGVGAMAMRNPEMAKTAIGKLGKIVGTARLASMLSGLAPIKSALGNLGAPLIESAERRSLDPVREFVSGQTVKDWLKAFKTGDTGMIQGEQKWNIPGRIMGAGDYATQEALKRAGLNQVEADAATLQTPLGQNFGKIGKVLEGPVGQVTIPFRRTPFNQFYEGFKTMTPDHLRTQGRVTAAATASGAAAGSETKDERYPVLPALVAAVAGRYGVPVALGAFAGRHYTGGKGGGGIVGSILPVSEYGIEESLANPLKPLEPSNIGIARAYRRIVEGK